MIPTKKLISVLKSGQVNSDQISIHTLMACQILMMTGPNLAVSVLLSEIEERDKYIKELTSTTKVTGDDVRRLTE